MSFGDLSERVSMALIIYSDESGRSSIRDSARCRVSRTSLFSLQEQTTSTPMAHSSDRDILENSFIFTALWF